MGRNGGEMNASTKVFATLSLSAAVGEKIKKTCNRIMQEDFV